MNIIVQKFGGTSVANTQMLYKVSEHIIREYENGKKVVAVVSAHGGYSYNRLNIKLLLKVYNTIFSIKKCAYMSIGQYEV
ncbi:MAG: hypothetical protein FWF46_00420 [Oscillospiraceae bacterium]|nr:hypothetical protein [Oscillospiraceae bacterium]